MTGQNANTWIRVHYNCTTVLGADINDFKCTMFFYNFIAISLAKCYSLKLRTLLVMLKWLYGVWYYAVCTLTFMHAYQTVLPKALILILSQGWHLNSVKYSSWFWKKKNKCWQKIWRIWFSAHALLEISSTRNLQISVKSDYFINDFYLDPVAKCLISVPALHVKTTKNRIVMFYRF